MVYLIYSIKLAGEINPSASHSGFKVNVSNAADVESKVEEIWTTLGMTPTDYVALVNCAGITRDGWMVNMKEKDWDDVLDVNLKGTFLMTQSVTKRLKNSKQEGSVVNISSISGKTGNLGQVNYSASKAGVIGFTKAAAKELGAFNIRVNAVLPGFIETPMIDTVPSDVKIKLFKNIPLQGRPGKPEEVANVIEFLASKKASYVTGSAVEVTGGFLM
jgi:NAD(P)-dependent dehydrogenase (short-subunit alcohol dehydrogenase family)